MTDTELLDWMAECGATVGPSTGQAPGPPSLFDRLEARRP